MKFMVVFVIVLFLSEKCNGNQEEKFDAEAKGNSRNLLSSHISRRDRAKRRWVSNLDEFLGTKGPPNADSSSKISRSQLSAFKSLHEAFQCRYIPSSLPLPFPWFCHQSPQGVVLEGPNGPLQLKNLGRIHGKGPYLYHFNISKKDVGNVRVINDGKEEGSFKAKMDNCQCPQKIDVFKEQFQCSLEDKEKIEEFFGWWGPRSITRTIFDLTRYPPMPPHYLHVAIIKNQVYFRHLHVPGNWGMYWNDFTDLLKAVVRKVQVPDVEFYAHNTDFPYQDASRMGAPVFSFCSDPVHRDILMPSPDLIRDVLTGRSFRFITRSHIWEDRESKAYFRGDNTGHLVVNESGLAYLHPRFRAAILAKKNPKLFDVVVRAVRKNTIDKNTKQWALKEGIANIDKALPREHSQDFKFALALDGFAAPFRTSFLLASGSVVVRPKSPYFEHFYDDLIPGVHYLEIAENYSDMEEVVKWGVEHDERSKAIAQNAISYYSRRLRQEDLICWMAVAFERLSKSLAFEPEIAKDMEKLDLETDPECSCSDS